MQSESFEEKKSSIISVIVPLFNEAGTVEELHGRIVRAMGVLPHPYEIIFIDDASTDGTFRHMRTLRPLCAFRLSRNVGQTLAFAYGLGKARGDVIITLDGDLENMPEDIPRLFEKFQEGFDVVVGWRKERWQGQFLTRKLPSLLANSLISWVLRVHLHDFGCFLRMYKKEIARAIDFERESQRMLVPYAIHNGARVAEVAVAYRPRQYGASKFGLGRTFEVIMDVLALHFFHRFGRKPRHFFGMWGFLSFGAGGLVFLWMVYLKVAEGVSFIITPLPIVVAVFLVVGFQLILMGLLAEIITRHVPHRRPFDVEVAEEFRHS